MHVLQFSHDVDVHLLFCFDLDCHITCFQGHVKLRFALSILTDGYQKSYAILTNYDVLAGTPPDGGIVRLTVS